VRVRICAKSRAPVAGTRRALPLRHVALHRCRLVRRAHAAHHRRRRRL